MIPQTDDSGWVLDPQMTKPTRTARRLVPQQTNHAQRHS